MISFVNAFGALTSAAYSISTIITGYLQMPTMAIGASVSSMAAQNIGARRWDRVAKVARSGVISGLVVTGSIAVLLYLFNDQVLSILLPADIAGHPPGAPHQHHACSGVSCCSRSPSRCRAWCARPARCGWPMAILVVSMIGVRIPFAALLIPRFGADAIWWSFPLGTITSAVLTSLYYLHGGWRRARMLRDEPQEPPARGEPGSRRILTLRRPRAFPPAARRAYDRR